MTDRPLRVLLVCAHPVQYATPVFQLLANDTRVEVHVAYCSMQGAEPEVDLDFGVPVKWDIPLLDGYSWSRLPNWGGKPRQGSFFGLFNPGIWRMITCENFDAVVAFTGYVYATFWIALAAAKYRDLPFLFGTDAHELTPVDGKRWKVRVKKWLWPRLFRLADVVLVPSSGGVALMRSLRIPEDRIVLGPYCVNNEWWIEQSDRSRPTEVRSRWEVPVDAMVVLFCAKLQPWKRPFDLLRAFALITTGNAYLIFAGEGPLRPALEAEARSMGIAERIRFLGFVNQSGLPEIYTASDIFVLPSEYEPFGVVVNEAMLCQCPVIVSDRVGARFDLVRESETGFAFPAGNIQALAALLQGVLSMPEQLRKAGRAARARMQNWGPRNNVDATIEAVERAVRHRGEPKSARYRHAPSISADTEIRSKRTGSH
jgi:glycosyltransferase involved in cell wall biosynthesis